MNDGNKPTLNTYLGDVYWWTDCFFGTLEFICQDALGMLPTAPSSAKNFLDTTIHSVSDLWDFFTENELPDGRLSLTLSMSDMGGPSVAEIETYFLYGEEITDEDFIRLIQDFVAYARTRPIVDSSKREGAEITDESIKQMYEETKDQSFTLRDIPNVAHEICGLPHYLWLESLEFREAEERHDI